MVYTPCEVSTKETQERAHATIGRSNQTGPIVVKACQDLQQQCVAVLVSVVANILGLLRLTLLYNDIVKRRHCYATGGSANIVSS